MQPLPHVYSVSAAATASGFVGLSAQGLPSLRSAAPAEFGGPGDQWSPESLLAGAIASCFALTFRFVARAKNLEWMRLECHVDATLDRRERALQFTKAVVSAKLFVPPETDPELCRHVLERAEHECLITNSLRCERELLFEIVSLETA